MGSLLSFFLFGWVFFVVVQVWKAKSSGDDITVTCLKQYEVLQESA